MPVHLLGKVSVSNTSQLRTLKASCAATKSSTEFSQENAWWLVGWLVVWLPFFIFPYIGNFIIPIDFHIFQRGGPTTNQLVNEHRLLDHALFAESSQCTVHSSATGIDSTFVRHGPRDAGHILKHVHHCILATTFAMHHDS